METWKIILLSILIPVILFILALLIVVIIKIINQKKVTDKMKEMRTFIELERLDNVVYRMGFASTRRQARQLVNHGHFTLNGKKADIPSMHVKLGDEVKLKEKSIKNVQIVASLEGRKPATWIELDKNSFLGKLTRLPERKELNSEINEALIVEYYSK